MAETTAAEIRDLADEELVSRLAEAAGAEGTATAEAAAETTTDEQGA